jgi:hypothetical protein
MPSGLRRLGCRAVAFLASVVAVTILVLLALHDSHLGAWLVRENGVVEWLQVILMAIAGLLAARQGLAAFSQPELVSCLYCVDGSLTCSSEPNNLCLRGLCLKDVGRKAASVGRMAGRT